MSISEDTPRGYTKDDEFDAFMVAFDEQLEADFGPIPEHRPWSGAGRLEVVRGRLKGGADRGVQITYSFPQEGMLANEAAGQAEVDIQADTKADPKAEPEAEAEEAPPRPSVAALVDALYAGARGDAKRHRRTLRMPVARLHRAGGLAKENLSEAQDLYWRKLTSVLDSIALRTIGDLYRSERRAPTRADLASALNIFIRERAHLVHSQREVGIRAKRIEHLAGQVAFFAAEKFDEHRTEVILAARSRGGQKSRRPKEITAEDVRRVEDTAEDEGYPDLSHAAVAEALGCSRDSVRRRRREMRTET